MAESAPHTHGHDQVALVELVNRVVDRGVALGGEITISVADVDLLHVSLRLLLCSAERMEGYAPRLETRPAPPLEPGRAP